MKTLQFSISISAPPERVWRMLWNDSTYREWTSVFTEGSHAVSAWTEGSKVQFLDPKGNGMYSVIERSIPDQFMSFRHIGMIKDGVEQPLDEETSKWSGCHENYSLEAIGGGTLLRVDIDMTGEHQDYFSKVFPEALLKVKELSEN